MIKKLIATMIIICFVFSFVTAYAEHWADDTISVLHERGFIANIDEAYPNDSITRAEFIKLINKCFNYRVQMIKNYEDVYNSKWYYKDFGTAKYIGYLTGDDNGNVNPENAITRAECAVIIGRILNSKQRSENSFTDQESIPNWAFEYICMLSAEKIITGYPNGTFAPNNKVLRGEAFSMIRKLNDLIRFTEGDGSVENPYIIKTAYQFNHIRNYIWDNDTYFYELGSDIDLTKLQYKPTGNQDFAFHGILDGKGHTVKYDILEADDDYAGLFRYNDGTIKSLNVMGNVVSKVSAGLIVAQNNGNLLHCNAQGSVSIINDQEKKEFTAGGLVGINNSYIYACSNNAKVTIGQMSANSVGYAGGICGFNNREISASINAGVIDAKIEKKNEIAGENLGTVNNCYTEKEGLENAPGMDLAVWRVKDGKLIQTPFLSEKVFKKGEGTKENPYHISTPQEFSSVRFYSNAYFIVENDIDMKDYNGFSYFENFYGNLNGNGKSIQNLKLERENMRRGAVFLINNGTITGLRLENCDITARTDVAGICNTNNGTVKDCSVSGKLNLVNETMSSIDFNLGAIASINNGSIINCVNDAEIQAISGGSNSRFYVGGIAGQNSNLIEVANNNGTIEVIANGESTRVETGGIAGSNLKAEIYQSNNQASVTVYSKSGEANAGGISSINAGNIINCTNNGKVSAKSDGYYAYAAGISSQNNRAVELCENSGDVSSNSKDKSAFSGGIAARSNDWIAVCKNKGNIFAKISNQENVSVSGGIVGQNFNMVSQCENWGQVTAIGGNVFEGNICGIDK